MYSHCTDFTHTVLPQKLLDLTVIATYKTVQKYYNSLTEFMMVLMIIIVHFLMVAITIVHFLMVKQSYRVLGISLENSHLSM